MDQNTLTNSPDAASQENIKKKGNYFLIAGIVVAIISAALNGLKLPFYEIFSQITGVSIFIALILLFLKDYRYIGKKYLLGIFGTLIGAMILSFIVVLIIGIIKK